MNHKFDGVAGGFRRAAYRSCGYDPQQIRQKPHIGIANTYNESAPGHALFKPIVESIKAGIWAAGGIPVEFGVPSTCGNHAIGTPALANEMAIRDIVAASVEIVSQIHLFDGIVLTAGCDNIIPGMMLAAARLNLPTVLFVAGPMMSGCHGGKKATLSDVNEYVCGEGKTRQGSEALLTELEAQACPTMGACPEMGTANTMQLLAEVMGLTLTGNATIPAYLSERRINAFAAGQRCVELVREGVCARDIITPFSIENALIADLTVGGSTNAVLHLLALSREIGGTLTLDDFDRWSRKIPVCVNVTPSGPHTADELHSVGGVPGILYQVRDHIHPDCMTVNGLTVGEIIARGAFTPSDIIRPKNDPVSPTGGIAVVKGNLSPDGAIVRTSAMSRRCWQMSGPAVVFDSDDAAAAAVTAGQIQKGDMIVVRYAGPAGAPGMVEIHQCSDALNSLGLAEDVAIITDGRFSGFNHGAFVGHVVPEACRGGMIAYIKNGDLITLDVEKREISVAIAPEELEQRKQQPIKRECPVRSGFMKLYADTVLPANLGAAMQSW